MKGGQYVSNPSKRIKTSLLLPCKYLQMVVAAQRVTLFLIWMESTVA